MSSCGVELLHNQCSHCMCLISHCTALLQSTTLPRGYIFIIFKSRKPLSCFAMQCTLAVSSAVTLLGPTRSPRIVYNTSLKLQVKLAPHDKNRNMFMPSMWSFTEFTWSMQSLNVCSRLLFTELYLDRVMHLSFPLSLLGLSQILHHQHNLNLSCESVFKVSSSCTSISSYPGSSNGCRLMLITSCFQSCIWSLCKLLSPQISYHTDMVIGWTETPKRLLVEIFY